MAFVGIDLGTTFSALAVIDESGNPKIVHNKDGQNVTPSCVSEHDGIIEVGEYARKTWGESPESAVARFKRHMGTNQKYRINGKEFSPTELSAFVLKKLVKDAEEQIGKIEEAVITIPANFSHEARDATLVAAKAAGLNVKYIINEPTAAALYYAFKNGVDLKGVYAVYDLGGGTFDISVIKADGHEIQVLASNGVHKLGGDDFDTAIINIVIRKFQLVHNQTIGSSDFSKNDAEEVKKTLSNRKSAKVKFGSNSVEITREEFEESISALITQTEMLCESTLDEAKVLPSEVAGIFLVGGSSRVPSVRESVKKLFGKEPESTVNVDEVVALGASLYTAFKGDRAKLSPVQNKTIEKIKVGELTGKCFGTIAFTHDQNRDKEAVANMVLIKKGEKLPCSVTESFFTIYDGQDGVRCKVTESTSPETDPNFVKIIWEGRLELPPGRPKGQEIKVTYAYDENQIMKCTFVDAATGRETKIDLTLAGSTLLDSDKIRKFMVE